MYSLANVSMISARCSGVMALRSTPASDNFFTWSSMKLSNVAATLLNVPSVFSPVSMSPLTKASAAALFLKSAILWKESITAFCISLRPLTISSSIPYHHSQKLWNIPPWPTPPASIASSAVCVVLLVLPVRESIKSSSALARLVKPRVTTSTAFASSRTGFRDSNQVWAPLLAI